MSVSLVAWNKTDKDNLVIQKDLLRKDTSVIEGQIISTTDNTTSIPEVFLCIFDNLNKF
ncbi:unnamed protein product [Meloidogyne enterolobii]|uniref:Uncharacterized protein n=1 Tax=Meloidogyne enterolobii TaxID=390850 RepID=A0ACB0YE93_MELEN